MQAPYSEWIGRYLCLYDDGTMDSVTINDDYSEDVYRVKGNGYESNNREDENSD